MKAAVERPVIERQNLFLSPRGDAGFWFAEPGVCDSIEVVTDSPVTDYPGIPASCIKVSGYKTTAIDQRAFRLYYEQPVKLSAHQSFWLTLIIKHTNKTVNEATRRYSVAGRNSSTGEWFSLNGEFQFTSQQDIFVKRRLNIKVPGFDIDALRILPVRHTFTRTIDFWFAAPLISLTEPSTGSDYYFDGSTTPPVGLFSRWLGAVNRSVSVQYRREVQSLETSGVSLTRRLSWSPTRGTLSVAGVSGTIKVRGSDG